MLQEINLILYSYVQNFEGGNCNNFSPVIILDKKINEFQSVPDQRLFLYFSKIKNLRDYKSLEYYASDQKLNRQFSSRIFKHERKVQVHPLIQSLHLIVRTNVMKYCSFFTTMINNVQSNDNYL